MRQVRVKAGAGVVLAAGILLFSGLARPRTMQVKFETPQVCKCGMICAEHRTCTIPMCTGDFYKDQVEQVARVKRPAKHIVDPQTDELAVQTSVSSAEVGDTTADTQ